MDSLLIQTAFLGDLLLSIPLIKRLKLKGSVTLVCRHPYGQLFRELKWQKRPLVDECLEVRKGDSASYEAATSLLRARKFDVLINAHISFRSYLLALGIPAQKRVSYKRWFNFFGAGYRVQKKSQRPEALRQLELASVLDPELDELMRTNSKHEYFNNPMERQGILSLEGHSIPEWAQMCLDDHMFQENAGPPMVMLAPGSVWPTKRWTEEGYQSVARHFLAKGHAVTWFGSKEEASLCERLQRAVPNTDILCSDSVLDSLESLKTASVLVANDSGAMHLAAVAGVPVVSVFGPTTLALGFRPWQTRSRVVQIDIGCRPCGRHGHTVCPIGTHSCMKDLSANMVINATENLLAGLPNAKNLHSL